MVAIKNRRIPTHRIYVHAETTNSLGSVPNEGAGSEGGQGGDVGGDHLNCEFCIEDDDEHTLLKQSSTIAP